MSPLLGTHRFLGFVEAALNFVGPCPATRTRVLAWSHGLGRWSAANGEVALGDERVKGKVVALLVVGDVIVSPRGQGIELYETKDIIPSDDGSIVSSGCVNALE